MLFQANRYVDVNMSPEIRRLAAIVIVLLLSCARIGSAADAIRMATTTSTENSGLLNALITPFTEKTGIKIHVIAVGSGKALRLGANGDVDLILVHAPAAEAEFVENGYGIIAVNPERHPHVRYEESRQFIRWLTGNDGQQLIDNFRVNGKQLFHKSKEAAGAEK